MKITKRKTSWLLFGIIVIACLSVLIFTQMKDDIITASADTNRIDDIYYSKEVPAEFAYTPLNDNECSVRITNDNEATEALIHSTAEIDGKEYTVTEVELNGFMSSPKLKNVSLPYTIKKIRNSAFADCPELENVYMSDIVDEIGNYAFMECPKLKAIIIPESVKTIGKMIFRDNDTSVHVIASSVGENWSATWNSNNANQDVEFDSKYEQKMNLTELYSVLTRSDEAEAYSVSKIQPYYFYKENNNIYVPAVNPEDGLPIVRIEMNAFKDQSCDSLFVEYSDRTLIIEDYAFRGINADKIVINRNIEYEDEYTEEIFTKSTMKSVILPKTITKLTDAMFYNCARLEDLNFINPIAGTREIQEEELNKLPLTNGIIKLPATSNFDTIGAKAFFGTTSIKELHIYGNVKNVGANILDNWDENQAVFIHNDGPIPEYDKETETGWNPKWNSDFTNIGFFHKVDYDAKGGTVEPDKDEILVGSDIELPIPNHDDGHRFEGWYKDGEPYTDTTFNEETSIVLEAKWSIKINLVDQSEQVIDTIYVCLNDPMPMAKKPTTAEIGYKFEGYYSKPNGQGTKYYDEYMSSVHDWDIDEETTLYANYELIYYNVTYIEYDERDRIVRQYTVTLNCYDPIGGMPTWSYQKGYIFDGWYLDGAPIESQATTLSDVTLIGIWRGVKVAPQPSTVKPILAGEYLIIELTQQFNTYFELNILASTKYVYIYSDYPDINYNMYITFEARTDDVELHLDNVSFTAPTLGSTPTNGITIESAVMLNLYTYGTVNISGAVGGSSTSGVGSSGGRGIRAHYLTIWEASSKGGLHIYGGKGGDGIATSNSVRAGNGGNGAEAIYAIHIIIKTYHVYLTGGNGGNGGRGSSLVTSGNGGKGSSAYMGNLMIDESQFWVYTKDGTDGLNGYFA